MLATVLLPADDDVSPARSEARLLERSVGVVERGEMAPAGVAVPFDDDVPEVQHERQAPQAPVSDRDRSRPRSSRGEAGRPARRATPVPTGPVSSASAVPPRRTTTTSARDVRREVARDGPPGRARPGPAGPFHLGPCAKPRRPGPGVAAEGDGVVGAPKRTVPTEDETRVQRVRAGGAQYETARRLAGRPEHERRSDSPFRRRWSRRRRGCPLPSPRSSGPRRCVPMAR